MEPQPLPVVARHRYLERFRRVCGYIEHHLEQPLRVEQLATLARCSKFHFHRQFTGLLGLNVGSYIQLCRLKQAAYQLAYRAQQSVFEIDPHETALPTA